VSATVAPGGLGKSSLVLAEAVTMASGRELLGVKSPKPLRVWYVNLEDPREAIERRASVCISASHRRISVTASSLMAER
jgi:RecA-family ATPase